RWRGRQRAIPRRRRQFRRPSPRPRTTPLPSRIGTNHPRLSNFRRMIDYEKRGQTAVITIRRPEARNAVNAEVSAGIEAALDRFESEDDTWVAVLTGEGTVFCAGADLKAIASGQAGSIQTQRGGFGGVVTRQRTKPLIAAVDGP